MSLVKWLWDFGDGSTSTEQNPKHTYLAPGVYTVTLTVTDDTGNDYTIQSPDLIYVYAYELGKTGLVSGYTDQCFRLAIKPSQGQGIMPMSGKWVWPMVSSATAKGYNKLHESISLVVNAEDMKIYQIGIPELWVDHEGGYDEAEIECEAMLPEISSRGGTQENIRHVETHASMRPWDEKTYRGKAGYTADGFRNDQVFGIEVYENGEQIAPTALLTQVDKDGDYAFLKEIECKRIQLKLKYAASAFRTTRIMSHCEEIDFRTPPQLNDVPEKIWQKEFSSPDIWFSKNKPSIATNRGDGVVWSGNGVSMYGPDNKNGAFNSAGLSSTTGYVISDFFISGWMWGDGTIYSAGISGGGTVSFYVAGDVLVFTDGIDTVSWSMVASSTWRHLAVVRNLGVIELYEAGLLRASQVLTGVRSYGGATVVGMGSVFDIRRNTKVISGDAIHYYYDSIINQDGNFLP